MCEYYYREANLARGEIHKLRRTKRYYYIKWLLNNGPPVLCGSAFKYNNNSRDLLRCGGGGPRFSNKTRTKRVKNA